MDTTLDLSLLGSTFIRFLHTSLSAQSDIKSDLPRETITKYLSLFLASLKIECGILWLSGAAISFVT